MAQKAKLAKAFKAMRSLGYTQKIVRPILTNLLKLYENNWKLIEEENYKLLADSILDSEEEKAQKDKSESYSFSEDEDEDEEYERLIKRSKTSTSSGLSEIENHPHTKQKTIEPSYKLHQYMDTQLNTSYTSRYHHGKGKNSSFNLSHRRVEQKKEKNLIYDVESVESNYLAPLAIMEYDGDETGLSLVVSDKRMVTHEKLMRTNVHKEQDGPSDGDLDSEEDAIDNYQCETVLESDLLPLERPEYVVPLEMLPPGFRNCPSCEIRIPAQTAFDSPRLFTLGSYDIIYPDAKGICSVFPAVIDVDADYIFSIPEVVGSVGNNHDLEGIHVESMNHKQLEADTKENDAKDSPNLGINSSNSEGNLSESMIHTQLEAGKNENDAKDSLNLDTDSSNLEGHHSESTSPGQPEAEENKNDAKDSLNLDIASSSNGEVKISLMVEPSLRSGFHIPCLEEVMKQVEVQSIKSYKIPQTGFSILRLMNDLCERFLVAGTTSTCTDNIATTVMPSSGVLKDSDSKSVPSKGNDFELCLHNESTISNDQGKFHSPFEASPQVSKFINSEHFGSSICTVDAQGCDKNRGNIGENDNVICSSTENMIVQKQHFFRYLKDITKGQEVHEISLINEINDEPNPTFNYITKNVKYQNACVKFPLAHISEENCCSKCLEDCLCLDIPCACARETGGEFAYAPGGLVKEQFLDNCISMNHSTEKQNLVYCQDCPVERSSSNSLSGTCKGHLVRKFIKECWYKCLCSMKCGNRVVQQGIRVKLQVFMTSEGKGWGVRTLEDVPKGSFICEYVGEVVTNTELYERNMHSTGDKPTHPVLLDADWSSEAILKDEKALCLDATAYGNVARFINHRCFDANLLDIPVEIETPHHHYYHLAFFTTRKINAFEELTWDYGIDFNDHSHPVKAFQCNCGSKFCRDQKSANS